MVLSQRWWRVVRCPGAVMMAAAMAACADGSTGPESLESRRAVDYSAVAFGSGRYVAVGSRRDVAGEHAVVVDAEEPIFAMISRLASPMPRSVLSVR